MHHNSWIQLLCRNFLVLIWHISYVDRQIIDLWYIIFKISSVAALAWSQKLTWCAWWSLWCGSFLNGWCSLLPGGKTCWHWLGRWLKRFPAVVAILHTSDGWGTFRCDEWRWCCSILWWHLGGTTWTTQDCLFPRACTPFWTVSLRTGLPFWTVITCGARSSHIGCHLLHWTARPNGMRWSRLSFRAIVTSRTWSRSIGCYFVHWTTWADGVWRFRWTCISMLSVCASCLLHWPSPQSHSDLTHNLESSQMNPEFIIWYHNTWIYPLRFKYAHLRTGLESH